MEVLILVSVVVVVITVIIIVVSSLLGLSSCRNVRSGSWIRGRASPPNCSPPVASAGYPRAGSVKSVDGIEPQGRRLHGLYGQAVHVELRLVCKKSGAVHTTVQSELLVHWSPPSPEETLSI